MTKSNRRFAPAIDSETLDDIADLARECAKTNPKQTKKWIAEQCHCSPSTLRRAINQKYLPDHMPNGPFVIWISPTELGGEIRLLARTAPPVKQVNTKRTTFKLKYAARYATHAIAEGWLKEYRDHSVGPGCRIGSLNPRVININTLQ